ncbi:MAG: gluconokinase [Pseudomonadota bacterium]|nr:gluconokinase [Pseudomonadota bacterium]
MVILVMGVSGSGKSTIGARLAERLGARFIEGDDHHPAANVDKMRAGVPLDDDDREPWLLALNTLLRQRAGDARPTVLACSALKARYREQLRAGLPGNFRTVALQGSPALIAARVASREHHYMPAALLASQFAALEALDDAEALVVDVDAPVERIVEELLARLHASA